MPTALSPVLNFTQGEGETSVVRMVKVKICLEMFSLACTTETLVCIQNGPIYLCSYQQTANHRSHMCAYTLEEGEKKIK